MAKSLTHYTDRKNIRHTVTHRVLSADNPDSAEQLLEEIRSLLIRQTKKTSKPSV